ncbi:MAG: hypothetical protein WC797_04255, partial [Candidatus Paceibacterota bacterium]
MIGFPARFFNGLMQNRKIVILCFFVFVFSLIHSFYFRIQPSVDARAYDAIGWNVAQGLGYREIATKPFVLDNAIMRVGPGYELFLAVIFFLFGHNYWPVWVVQAIFLTLSSFCAFVLSKYIWSGVWSERMGLIGAFFIGFSPD